MTIAYLALGSNLGSPVKQIRLAIKALRHLPATQVLKVASFYYSPAWGRKAQPSFCNTVVQINTCLAPLKLLTQCQAIEKRQGRYRRYRYGARTLDIDILLYGHLTINSPRLTIPHPRMLERDFVRIPLLEISHLFKM